MTPRPDELAGIVDLFGGLGRDDLTTALEHIAARQGTSVDPDAIETAIDDALEAYYLLELCDSDDPILAAGPMALPELPEHGEDLPHMMDVETSTTDADRLGDAMSARLEADVETALSEAGPERLETLLEVCYAADAWAPVDATEYRERLLEALPEE